MVELLTEQNTRKLFKNIKIYNPHFREFISGNLLIIGDQVEFIGQIDELPAEVMASIKAENTYDLNGKYVIPGLIDIHMHIESSMLAPIPFASAIIKHGVTSIVAEPHEIANVFGLEGIKEMIASAKESPVDIFWGIPSSVPSTSNQLETSGAEIALSELEDLLDYEDIVCLGEVMNNNAVLYEPDSKINKLIEVYQQKSGNNIIEGHVPSLLGYELASFIRKGITADHTLQNLDRLEARVKNGMFVEIQEKTLDRKLIEFINEHNIYDNLSLVTDDIMVDDLIDRGHLDNVIRQAIISGLPVIEAIHMATYTPARRMNLNDRGSLTPGKKADFIVLDSLEEFEIAEVYKDGRLVFSSTDILHEDNQSQNTEKAELFSSKRSFPEYFYNSVKLKSINSKDLNIIVSESYKDNEEVTCRLIQVKSDNTYTEEKNVNLTVNQLQEQEVTLNWEDSPYALAAVFERHGKNGNIARALIGGETIKRGAVATTYAHDHHNLYLIAHNKEDGIIAANEVIKDQGGIVVVEDGKIIAKLKLPVAGILTEESAIKAGGKLKKVTEALKHLGYNHYNIIMSLCTNTLPVSPALKLTDKGLIDVENTKIIDFFI